MPPNPQNLAPPFKPGQSGNPGGKTSAQRKLEVENAEKATRIRSALLDGVVRMIEDGMTPEIEANLLKLIKDSEDRGLGAPTAKTAFTDAEGNDIPASITLEIMRGAKAPDT